MGIKGVLISMRKFPICFMSVYISEIIVLDDEL